MNRHYPWFALLGVLLIALSLAMPASGSRVDPNAPAAEKPAADGDAAADDATVAPEAKTVNDLPREIPEPPEGGWDVYVVPIKDVITKPQLYILRRALKEAIANDVEVVLLDMDTPGGDLYTTLDMMEALDYFEGTTITFVDKDAISAGSYIGIATEDIWFAPNGVMGAAAAIQGSGQDIPPTLKAKIDSVMRARVRAISKEYRYRADVQRAMMDIDYRLEIDGKLIKEKGELLTVTADEAMELFGAPPQPLLAQGIATDIDDLLTQKFGAGNYNIRTFEVTWSEEFAKWFTTISPFLISAGVLLLIMEIKTPGFGAFGVGGITLLLLVFASQYFSGMAGNEPMLLFLIGVLLIGIEIFLVPGTLVSGMIGGACVLGSLIWTMADIWPEGSNGFALKPEVFYEPIGQVILGLGIAFLVGLALVKYLPESPLQRAIVLGAEVKGRSVDQGGGRSIDGAASQLPQPGDRGIATTDLHPGGQVEVNGRQFQANVLLGSIESGYEVEVVEVRDFSLIVRAV